MNTIEKQRKPIILNNYIAYYYPEHHRAYSNGCVYEHILVAETMLGRKLKDNECVHHKDYNKTNNSPGNLMVFATVADHTAFHGGSRAVINEDGAYYCPDKSIHLSDGRRDVEICPKCAMNYKSKYAKMCNKCRTELNRKHIPTKEELADLMTKMPNEKIAKIYHVSDKTIGNWIAKLGLKPRGRSGRHGKYYRELTQ